MLVLGINLGTTKYGKRLYDGAACLANEDGILVAVAEERISRIKHCGGYTLSTEYCLSSLGVNYRDLDLICVSSCVEPLRSVDASLGLPETLWEKIRIVPHHLSHACSAYLLSPFSEALIMVMDGGGNLLEPMHSKRWWEHSREQNSYYIASPKGIALLERQFDHGYDVGYGEAYRCFTEYLGFESDANASKVMSLAAYANPKIPLITESLFYYEDERLKCALRNYPPRLVAMLQDWAAEHNLRISPQRVSSEAILDEHIQLASYIQNQLENSVFNEIQRLHRKTGITNLCVAGGVALNCVLNGKILQNTPMQRLFVQPSAGDTGQAIGNALWGISNLKGGQLTHTTGPFLALGQEYDLSYESIMALSHADHFNIERCENIATLTAKLIAEGNIIGWFQGRSEFGPRALGNRSILADARFNGISKRLAHCKGREPFRPFAPSVLRDEASEIFHLQNTDYSYMGVTANVHGPYLPYISGAVHVDGTSRVQVVDASWSPRYYELIRNYFEMTGLPLILNTSFNKRGEPIVETPLDAIKVFRQMELDHLVIGDLILSKKERIKSNKTILVGPIAEVEPLPSSIDELIRQISSRFPNCNISMRTSFGLYHEYWDWILEKRKVTTVRYKQGAIDVPASSSIPVVLSKQGLHPGQTFAEPQVGQVGIKKITIKRFGDLDDHDGMRDGFSDAGELRSALKKYYGPISERELVTIYEFSSIDIY